MNHKIVCAILIFVFAPAVSFSQTSFSADSVYEHIRYLTQEIGPRPMGSAAERQALNRVAAKFRAYGADSAWVMPFAQVSGKETRLNTNSGVAIGIFHGDCDTSIVVGGHADTNSPESPGANDNASGTATAIELARIWSQRPRHYTMIFISFGGEEMGLYGSHYFADNFKEIDKVGLMISADMTGGQGDIVTIMETKEAQAPRWLVRDAFRLNREMGISPLRYPTHFATFNTLIGGAGSDHEPFLEANIPAMDFTTGINTSPIHSARDNLANIDRSQLDQCGRFIDRLLNHYQTRLLPARKLDHYTLWVLFGHPLFIPKWVLVMLLSAAVPLGTLAFLRSRSGRIVVEKSQRIRFSPAKLVLLFLVAAGFSQGGEALIQAINGVRYPWLLHVLPYLALMAGWAIGGIWLALRLSRRWRWNPDPHVYASRALVLLALLTIASAFASTRLAVYPGLSLLFFALAVLSRPSIIKIILAILTPLPLLRLVFSEATEFIARNTIEGGMAIDNVFKASLYTGAIILLLLALFLPFISSSAYIIARIPSAKNAVKSFRKPIGGVIIAILLFAATWAASRLPAYDNRWRPSVRLQAEYGTLKEENKLNVVGNDYFRDIGVRGDSLDMHFPGRTHKEKLPVNFSADWVTIGGSETRKCGEKDTVAIDWLLRSKKPWHAVTLSINADTLEISGVAAEWDYQLDEGKLDFSWSAQPPESLRVKASFVIHQQARLVRKLTATFLEPPLPIELSSQFASVSYRTKVILSDTVIVNGHNNEKTVSQPRVNKLKE